MYLIQAQSRPSRYDNFNSAQQEARDPMDRIRQVDRIQEMIREVNVEIKSHQVVADILLNEWNSKKKEISEYQEMLADFQNQLNELLPE